MNTRRRTLLGTGLAAAMGGWSSAAWSQAKPGATRKIILGQSVPLTGAASEIGLAFAAGAKLYVDAFNARKNNPGWNFELRQLDDGYDPAKATANAKKLLDQDLKSRAGAPQGKAGSLLLDPQDIIIANGLGAADDSMVSDGQILAAEPESGCISGFSRRHRRPKTPGCASSSPWKATRRWPPASR